VRKPVRGKKADRGARVRGGSPADGGTGKPFIIAGRGRHILPRWKALKRDKVFPGIRTEKRKAISETPGEKQAGERLEGGLLREKKTPSVESEDSRGAL